MRDEMNNNPVIGKSFDFHGELSTFIRIFPTGKKNSYQAGCAAGLGQILNGFDNKKNTTHNRQKTAER
jgi:hypothetical protein